MTYNDNNSLAFGSLAYGTSMMMMIGNPPTTAATMMMMMDTFSNSQLYFALRLALVVDMMVAVVVDGLL